MPTTMTRRLCRSAGLALAATLLSATAAIASPPGWTPQSGDDRATAHAGNVTTCAQAGLPGDTVTWPGLEDAAHTHVTITSADIPAGETLLAVVVKGGPGYNVYQGLTAWTGLHSPLNVGGQIPTISHWFACVTKSTSGGGGGTTSTTSTTDTTTTRPAGSSTTTASTTTTNAAASGSTTTTTVAGAAAATTTTATGTKNLAYTGFDNGWLVWVGALLLILGGGAVALPRVIRRRS